MSEYRPGPDPECPICGGSGIEETDGGLLTKCMCSVVREFQYEYRQKWKIIRARRAKRQKRRRRRQKRGFR